MFVFFKVFFLRLIFYMVHFYKSNFLIYHPAINNFDEVDDAKVPNSANQKSASSAVFRHGALSPGAYRYTGTRDKS